MTELMRLTRCKNAFLSNILMKEHKMFTLKDPSLFRDKCFINGRWADADNGQTIDVTNPATGEKIGTIPKMGADETRRAIEAANAALPEWRTMTAAERSTILRR